MESNYSLADLSAACGCNNGNNAQWNNPMWLIWALLFGFGGNGWNRGAAGQGLQDAEIMSQLNSIRQQMNDNQNTNALGGAIGGNHDLLHGLNNGMNMGFAGTNATINAASTGNLLGQKDAAMQMSNCCCGIKEQILTQGANLTSRIDQLANGISQGFAQVGFLTQSQTNELTQNANANTQRILDKLCADTTQDLRDKLAAASQNAQTAYLISQLKTTA